MKKHTSKYVHIYRNLHKPGYFSIKHKNKVIYHSQFILLENCSFVVTKSGKTRALQEQKRNVHATIRGTIVDYDFDAIPRKILKKEDEITYKPFENKLFHYKETGEEIISAKKVILGYNKCWILEK